MKKILIAILMLMPVMANAYDVQIGGIYYNLITKAKIAEVTYQFSDGRGGASSDYAGDIVIPEKIEHDGVIYTITTITSKAFYGCKNLNNISMPNTITSIGYQAFRYCYGLQSVLLSSSLETIGDGAFDGCYEIESIVIPSSVTSIGKEAYGSCRGITSISVEEGNTVYDSRDNCNAIIETASNTLIAGCKNTIIPNSITTIGDCAFVGCESLTSVSLPLSLTTIGSNAFQACIGLEQVIIPGSVTTIGVQAFSNCSGLKTVEIPYSVTYIDRYAFYLCEQLTSITIPGSVYFIGELAFYGCTKLSTITIENRSGLTIDNNVFGKCTDLKDVYCYMEEPPYAKQYAFNESYIEYATLHVPESAIENYKNRSPWNGFGSIIALIGEIPAPQKCAKPTISFIEGKLLVNCETEGAECVTIINDEDIKTHVGNEIDLTVTYTISVYATATGFENSDVATATLCWLDAEPKTEGMIDNIASARGNAVMIQTNRNIINVAGVESDTDISVFDISGTLRGTAKSHSNSSPVAISTNFHVGDIAIVKIGSKSVKVLMK